MNEGQLSRLLTAANPWWRDRQAWRERDRQLRAAKAAPFDYMPTVLDAIAPDGLYVLYGPRRVGKSVVLKQRIADLLDGGTEPRRIIYYSCDGLTAEDLRRLENVGREILTRGVDEPRIWFLDEVTDVPGWPATVKWLRDQRSFAEDCVVLTGSSTRDLAEARKQLGGRRGQATETEIALLPMSFRAFARAIGIALPAELPVVGPERFVGEEARAGIDELLPWLDDLLTAWELYLQVGGMPEAIAGQLSNGSVPEAFLKALWGVIHGDALRRGRLTANQTTALLQRLSLNLAGRTNLTHLAEAIGVGSHHTAKERLSDLEAAMIVWPCHRLGDRNLPALNAQTKFYFTDPLYSRIPHWVTANAAEPDSTALTEQQIGLALARALPNPPGSPDAYASPMYAVTKSKEIDFVGPEFGPLGFEGKYVDRNLGREALPLRARLGAGVLATRSVLNLDDQVWAVPAPFIATLLNG